jgi:basic membrane protein A
VIFDLGGKFDKSFNESSFNGATRWAEETGGTFAEFELTDEAQREQAIRRFAEAATTHRHGGLHERHAAQHHRAPTTRRRPSSSSTPWWTSPTSARSSSTSMRAPTSWACSPAWPRERHRGLRGRHGHPAHPQVRLRLRPGRVAANPDATVIANFTGTTPAAWNDPARGSELTRPRSARGPTWSTAAAGATGLGEPPDRGGHGNLSIGVDANQTTSTPGEV